MKRLLFIFLIVLAGVCSALAQDTTQAALGGKLAGDWIFVKMTSDFQYAVKPKAPDLRIEVASEKVRVVRLDHTSETSDGEFLMFPDGRGENNNSIVFDRNNRIPSTTKWDKSKLVRTFVIDRDGSPDRNRAYENYTVSKDGDSLTIEQEWPNLGAIYTMGPKSYFRTTWTYKRKQ